MGVAAAMIQVADRSVSDNSDADDVACPRRCAFHSTAYLPPLSVRLCLGRMMIDSYKPHVGTITTTGRNDQQRKDDKLVFGRRLVASFASFRWPKLQTLFGH